MGLLPPKSGLNLKNLEQDGIKPKLTLPRPVNLSLHENFKGNSGSFWSNLNLKRSAYLVGIFLRSSIFLTGILMCDFIITNLFNQAKTFDNLKIIKFYAYQYLTPFSMTVAAMIIDAERSKILNMTLIISDIVSIYALSELSNSIYHYFSFLLKIIYVALIIGNIIIYSYD